jgi:murein DD-endopeptidase MepM/ murein hydrolase activator NlpD
MTWRHLPVLLLSLSLAPSLPASAQVTHTVDAGQTLWSIAHAYGVTVEDLVRVNRIDDATEILAGQRLTIPGAHRPVPPGPVAPELDPVAVRLEWPLDGHVTSLYGRRRRAFHSGLDVAAIEGTIIAAAADGTVARADGRWGRYGKVVLVQHGGGYHTLYAHASRVFVQTGQRVRRGQAIAAVGATGNATGPHLHFEVWVGDRTIDPLSCLQTR